MSNLDFLEMLEAVRHAPGIDLDAPVVFDTGLGERVDFYGAFIMDGSIRINIHVVPRANP